LLIGGAAMELSAVLFFAIGFPGLRDPRLVHRDRRRDGGLGLLPLKLGRESDDVGADDRRIRETGVPGREVVEGKYLPEGTFRQDAGWRSPVHVH
jgi:hypothetical protein